MSSFIVTGYAKKNDSILGESSTEVDIADAGTLTMTKTVDKPGEFYIKGDTIVFTIEISVPASSPAKLYGIRFEDQIPPQVSITGITTTKGLIEPVVSNKVKVTAINLEIGETCTVVITGKIA